MPSTSEAWWRSGVLYQIYPRSFADTDGDGHGDLQGIIERLDHLAWLGVDGIWLNPIHPSQNADWGYDVADYRAVAPEFGDLDAVDRLIAGAAERGIRVLLDLVPNHTSDHHPWFEDACSSRSARHRDWYVWADPRPDGSPPNNWVSMFGGPAWTWDERTEQYFLHNFLAAQPDLNWWNEQVREAFDAILRFWLDRGVAGFRIDVAHGIVHDRSLRDNPPATEDDDPEARERGQRAVYNMNRLEVHDIFRRWRVISDSYDPARVLLGETVVFDVERLMPFYGVGGDELHLVLNFPFMLAALGAGTRAVVETCEAGLPMGAWPLWVGSTHDGGRFPTRWCHGDERKVRAALFILLTLRGTPILYYGDEIGMPETAVPQEQLRDPVGVRGWPEQPGRDRARTPMPWNSEPGGGFTNPDVSPWLPLGDTGLINVEDQRREPGSVLHLCRDLIALRRERTDLAIGGYAGLPAPPGVWAWKRGTRTTVVINASDDPTAFTADRAKVVVGTRRERDGERVAGRLELEPWEAAILDAP